MVAALVGMPPDAPPLPFCLDGSRNLLAAVVARGHAAHLERLKVAVAHAQLRRKGARGVVVLLPHGPAG